MAQEIELKLAFPPAAREAILQHPLLAAAERQGRAQTLINTYYDTPALDLSQRRVALRTRKAGRRWLQTVKCAAESLGGLSSRPEWEQPFSGSFDFSAIDAQAVSDLLLKHADAIVPLFTTNFRRETLLLRPRAGVVIHVMVDVGEISANGRTEPISELELELETGTADDLFAIACELAASLPLLPYDPSKAARGYRLFRDEAITPTRNVPVEITGMRPLDAFRLLAHHAVAVWAANQHAAPASEDPEYIHQLRLTLRRLRNLLRLFAAVLPEAFVTYWVPRLAALAEDLAEARDLEVLCKDVLPPEQAAALPVAAYARHQADLAATQAHTRLQAAGAGLPLLLLSRALHALPEPEQQAPLPKLAKQALHETVRLARHRLKAAQRDRQSENMHLLRIAIKRLRHACEIFSAELPERIRTRRLDALAGLQSALGDLHDNTVALTHLHEWAKEDRKLREAVAFVTGWLTATNLQLDATILARCAHLLDKKRWSRRKPSRG